MFMAFCAYHRITGQKSKLHVLNHALESVYVLPPKTHMYKEPAIISAWMPHGSLIVVFWSSSTSSADQVFCSSLHTPDNASVSSLHANDDVMQLLNSSCVVLLSCALGVGASVAFSPDARHVGTVHKPDGSGQPLLRLYNTHDGSVADSGVQGGMLSCCTLTFAARGDAVLLGSYKAISVVSFGEHSLGAYSGLCDAVNAAACQQLGPIGTSSEPEGGMSPAFIATMQAIAAAIGEADAAGDDAEGSDEVGSDQ